MSHALTSRSPDLRRLRDEGFEVAIVDGQLVVRNIPYVTPAGEIGYGTLVSGLELAGDHTARPGDHVARFAGEQPCDRDGRPLTTLINSVIEEQVGDDIRLRFLFSQKPDDGYRDYYHKMTTYIAMLQGPAQALDPDVTARTHRVVEDDDPDAIFRYLDTATGRAGISASAAKMALDKVAIIGLGGTGAHILDNIAKTMVRQIHLFDGDVFQQHCAFRAPGATPIEQLHRRMNKVDYYTEMYSVMRNGIVAHPYYLTKDNVDELKDMTFVFIAIDDGPPKKHIIAALEKFEIPFIDVGMGLYNVDGAVGGILRVTTSTPRQRNHVHDRHRIPTDAADPDDEYERNIQTGDLNTLNAALAVLQWRKLYGSYLNLSGEHHCTFTIGTGALSGEDHA
ncbi:ThiF family adenylyltransferase [Actinoplanes sp. NPDC051859]|uniref:ThiF family adenylyltransferase n=1 Tax=Actinoplanes sp. NPDC051859 TaxID=3363909 RepID=UPI003795A18C